MFRVLVVASLFAAMVVGPAANPASATSSVSRIPDRPCPDLSQILPYQRGGAVSDRRGGAFVAWVDDRMISVQHFGPTGAIVGGWPAPGLALGWISPGDEGVQSFVAADLAGGAFVAWIGHEGEVRLQRMTPACGVAPGWPADGVVLCALAGTGRFPAVVACGRGSAMIIWREQEITGVQSIRLARVEGGTLAAGWPANGRVLESGNMLPQVADLVPDDLGGAIAYWCRPAETEGRTSLVLERILANGDTAPGWPAGGLVVAERVELGLHIDEENGEPQLAADGRNGAWLVWCATHPVRREEYESDVFAVRVTGGGRTAPGWPAGGRTIVGERGDQHRAVIACDPEGLLVGWGDGVDGGRIGLAHVDGSGSVRDWGRLAAMSLERLAIGPDGRSGAYVACTAPGYAPRLLRWSAAGPGSPIGPPPTGKESDSSRLELVTEGGGALMFWADVEAGPPQYTRVRVTSTRTATGR